MVFKQTDKSCYLSYCYFLSKHLWPQGKEQASKLQLKLFLRRPLLAALIVLDPGSMPESCDFSISSLARRLNRWHL